MSDRKSYWTPDVAERIRKALADHKAGRSVPVRDSDGTRR